MATCSTTQEPCVLLTHTVFTLLIRFQQRQRLLIYTVLIGCLSNADAVCLLRGTNWKNPPPSQRTHMPSPMFGLMSCLTLTGDRGSTVVKVKKVAVSIPDGVIEIFHWHNTSDRTVALGSTRPLTPGVFPGGKGGRCVRLTTLPPSCAVSMKSGYLNFLEPSGPIQ